MVVDVCVPLRLSLSVCARHCQEIGRYFSAEFVCFFFNNVPEPGTRSRSLFLLAFSSGRGAARAKSGEVVIRCVWCEIRTDRKRRISVWRGCCWLAGWLAGSAKAAGWQISLLWRASSSQPRKIKTHLNLRSQPGISRTPVCVYPCPVLCTDILLTFVLSMKDNDEVARVDARLGNIQQTER